MINKKDTHKNKTTNPVYLPLLILFICFEQLLIFLWISDVKRVIVSPNPNDDTENIKFEFNIDSAGFAESEPHTTPHSMKLNENHSFLIPSKNFTNKCHNTSFFRDSCRVHDEILIKPTVFHRCHGQNVNKILICNVQSVYYVRCTVWICEKICSRNSQPESPADSNKIKYITKQQKIKLRTNRFFISKVCAIHRWRWQSAISFFRQFRREIDVFPSLTIKMFVHVRLQIPMPTGFQIANRRTFRLFSLFRFKSASSENTHNTLSNQNEQEISSERTLRGGWIATTTIIIQSCKGRNMREIPNMQWAFCCLCIIS